MSNTNTKAKAKSSASATKSMAGRAIETKNDFKAAHSELNVIFKGIDNSSLAVKKAFETIPKSIEGIKEGLQRATSIVQSITNSSMSGIDKNDASQKALKAVQKDLEKSKKDAEKAVKAAEKATEKAVKTAEKAMAKPVIKAVPAKEEKKAKPAKAKPEKEAKTASAPKASTEVDNRPVLKEVIKSILESATGPMSASDIFQSVKAKAEKEGFKVWSRQSIYNQLDDRKNFSKSGEKDKAVYTPAPSSSEEEVEAFLQKASKLSSVSGTV